MEAMVCDRGSFFFNWSCTSLFKTAFREKDEKSKHMFLKMCVSLFSSSFCCVEVSFRCNLVNGSILGSCVKCK